MVSTSRVGCGVLRRRRLGRWLVCRGVCGCRRGVWLGRRCGVWVRGLLGWRGRLSDVRGGRVPCGGSGGGCGGSCGDVLLVEMPAALFVLGDACADQVLVCVV